MPDIPPTEPIGGADPDQVVFDAQTVATLTGRHLKVIYRYIKNGTIKTVPDPTDGRRRLVPADQLLVIASRPHRGWVPRKVEVVRQSDGARLTIVTRVKPDKATPHTADAAEE